MLVVWPYYLLAFLSSAGIMTVELVASRLVAPYLGVNLYTWTSVIGVVLGGMTAGAFTGGWMADRWPVRRLLGWILIAAGGLVAAILPALPVVVDRAVSRSLPPLLGVLVPIALLFFVPAFTLALVSPMVYKLALRDLSRAGGTVGRLSACGALGSIAGTFATGFWLVPTLGTRVILVGVSAGMVLLGLAWLAWRPSRRAVVAVVALVLTATVLRQQPAFLRGLCEVESAYYCLRITWTQDNDERAVKQLVLDNLVHSGANPLQPDFLWYDYEKVMAWILQRWARPEMATFFIGGGGYTLPHWVERHFPAARVEVAEIDPAVTRMALKEFIAGPTQMISHHGDARQVLLHLPTEQRYDVIFGDAFNDISVPYHLTTREFARTIRQRLNPGGLYLANIIDTPGGPFQGAFVRTLAAVFPHVYLLPGDEVTLRGQSGPLVVVASLAPIPWAEWQTAAPPPYDLPLLGPATGTLVLTDDYAPVDNLLLPVLTARWQR